MNSYDKESNSSEYPLVSIIMNCYNGETHLKAAIDSVYAQTYQNWEIIFFDNFSADTSSQIALSYDEKIKYYRSDKNYPLGEARNLALEKVTGTLIAFLDTDDLWENKKLELQIQALKESKTEFVYSNYYIINEYASRKRVKYQNEILPSGNIFKEQLRDYTVGILTVLVTKNAIDNLAEKFDPTLNLVEEFDFFLRILMNANATYLATPLASYRVHSAMTSQKKFDKFYTERLYTLDKLKSQFPALLTQCKESQDDFILMTTQQYVLSCILYKQDLIKAKTLIHPYKNRNWKARGLYIYLTLPGSILIILNKIVTDMYKRRL